MEISKEINFKAHFHIEILDSERVILFSEDQHHLLEGEIYTVIAKIFQNGKINEKTLLDNLYKQFPIQLVNFGLQRLKEKGFIQEVSYDIPKHALAFWHDMGLDLNVIKKSKIVIQNFSSSSIELDLKDALNSLDIKTWDEGDFFIVIVDNYISKALEEFNIKRLLDHKPWILFKPTGSTIWLGPIFDDKITGCWNCLSKRLKENRRVEVDVFGTANDKLDIPSRAFLPTNLNIAINLVCNEVAKWLKTNDSHALNRNLLTFDLRSLEMRHHPFNRLLSCETCNLNKINKEQIPILKSSLKRFIFEEGERSSSLEASFESIKTVVSPITGVINSMRHGIVNEEHICYTIRNLPLPIHPNADRFIRIPDTATGKGKTKLQATVGCIAEAIERYNCTFLKQQELRTTYNTFSEQAIHPNVLLNFSDYQYENRCSINKQKEDGFNQIPKKYDDSIIGWTRVYSLIDSNFKYVPSSYCYLSYPFEKDVEMFPGNSNGCASGNTLEEAIYYAMLELIERDAVAIWWYNRIKRPSINLDVFRNASFNQIKSKFRKINREFHVLDLTHDLQIPCYAAVSWRQDGKRIFFGTGAHLNPQMGIARAISELNQVMIHSSISDDVNLNKISSIERDLVKWVLSENIENHPYIMPLTSFSSKKNHEHTNDFLDDIRILLEIFKQNNLNVFLLDLSNPDIPFYTVRIIIPGLRHFWNQLGPGRLYDVPVKLGWLPKSKNEQELNPIPYFL